MISLLGSEGGDLGHLRPKSPRVPSAPPPPQHPRVLSFVSCQGPLLCGGSIHGWGDLRASSALRDPLQESTAPRLVPRPPPPRGSAFVPWEWMGWVWPAAQGGLSSGRKRVGFGGGAAAEQRAGKCVGYPPRAEHLKSTGFSPSIVQKGVGFQGRSSPAPPPTFSSSIRRRTSRRPRGPQPSCRCCG